MLFSNALLNATYKNGRPPNLTEEHKKAEDHRFKNDFLFKAKAIRKELYASRLVQHYLIIKTIEYRLQGLSEEERATISPFFTLSYLDALWRTSGIEADLKQLDIEPTKIKASEIAPSTKRYVDNIKLLPPKSVLAHFLLHVAGFMHGGKIIQKRRIDPSNALTSYKIPANQYDFSAAQLHIPDNPSVMNLYKDLIAQVDTIEVNSDEYTELLAQCKSVYQTMSDIYDNLCVMHSHQAKHFNYHPVALASICLVVLIAGFKTFFEVNSFTPAP